MLELGGVANSFRGDSLAVAALRFVEVWERLEVEMKRSEKAKEGVSEWKPAKEKKPESRLRRNDVGSQDRRWVVVVQTCTLRTWGPGSSVLWVPAFWSAT